MNTSMLLRSISTVKSTVLSFAVELRKEKMNIASFIWILRSLRFFKYSIFLQNIIFFLKIIDFFSLFLSEPFIFFKCYGSVRFGLVRFGLVRFGLVRFGSVQYGSVQFSSVQFGSVWFSLVRFSSVNWTELNLLNRTIFTKVNHCEPLSKSKTMLFFRANIVNICQVSPKVHRLKR